VLSFPISLQSDVVAGCHAGNAKRHRLGLLLGPGRKPVILPITFEIVVAESSHCLDASSQVRKYFKYLLVSELLMDSFKVRPSRSRSNG
jgi:hypothetical protein